MNYLLDKKAKNKKITQIVLIGLFLLFVIYFRNPIYKGLASIAQTVFHPVIFLGDNASKRFSGMKYFFKSKQSLFDENNDLKNKLNEASAKVSSFETILNENKELKESMGRANIETEFILGVIISKPINSLYDTLLIDAGENDGVQVGKDVFAFGNIPIGKISEVYDKTSKVLLFSSPGEKTEVILPGRNIYETIGGRGGGNFELSLVRDITLSPGEELVLPGINPYVIARVETVISDPRDSFQKVLLVSPVNIQELKFVEIRK